MSQNPSSAWRGLAPRLACAATLVLAPVAQASSYQLLNLAPPPAYSTQYSLGTSINSAGQVVGYVNSASYPVAATWLAPAAGNSRIEGQRSVMPGSRNSIAAINDDGVMVGGYDGASGPVVMFNTGAGWQQMPWPDTRYTCCGQVDDINSAGVAVGGWYPLGRSSPTRFTPNAQGGYVADSLGGGQGGAVAINTGGQIVGTVLANGNSGTSQAVLWQPDKSLTRLGVLDATQNTSRATDLNDSTTVVGWSAAASGLRQGFVWSGGVMQAIGGLPGWEAANPGIWISNPQAINNAGTIVGHASTANGQQHGFMMLAGGTPVDLLSLVSPDDPFFDLPHVAADHQLTFIDATDINNAGQILALGTYRALGANHSVSLVTQAFVLTPALPAVPEPGTAALGLLGALGLWFSTRRRLVVGAGAPHRHAQGPA